MGRAKKPQPEKLAQKLAEVRKYLRKSQEEMAQLIFHQKENSRRERHRVSEYETGRRAPSLLEVFCYAKAVRDLTDHKNFNSDDLIDDNRDLPWLPEHNQ